MTTADALLRSVCERPDDMSLRLIYADCLEEAGEKEIHADVVRYWSSGEVVLLSSQRIDLSCSGWISGIRATTDDWFAYGPSIVVRQPVRKVEISDATIWQSGGNDTFYVGGLGRFPSKYWKALAGLSSRYAAREALNAVALQWARTEAGLPEWREE